MVITDEWIGLNATGKASWTREQLRLAGVAWPPQKGWRRWSIGRSIPDVNARAFERIGQEARARHAKRMVERFW